MAGSSSTTRMAAKWCRQRWCLLHWSHPACYQVMGLKKHALTFFIGESTMGARKLPPVVGGSQPSSRLALLERVDLDGIDERRVVASVRVETDKLDRMRAGSHGALYEPDMSAI